MLRLKWRYLMGLIGLVIWLALTGCVVIDQGQSVPADSMPTATAPAPTTPMLNEDGSIKLIPFEATTQVINFPAADGTLLAGQVDWPPDQVRPPLIVIIHHSGPVDRDAYRYLAARLVPAGYAVFRFDKRGNGRSGGDYGCCEADDALAAYRAAIDQAGYDPDRVYIMAQSLGTQILADHFSEFEQIHPPRGVILLSSLLEGDEVLPIRVPIHIIISDSEPNLTAIGEAAAQAHDARYHDGATFTIIPHTEHTLFDISAGSIDWTDPNWPDKFSEQAWQSLVDALKALENG